MTDKQSIRAYDRPERAQSYHQKKGFSPERKEEMLQVTVDCLVEMSAKSGTLLELGAGTGHLTGMVMDEQHFNEIIVTDGAKKMLNIAEKELQRLDDGTKLSYQILDFSSADWIVPFDSQEIHAVTSSMAIHHVEDKKLLFVNIHNVLSPGGVFVFADHMAGSTKSVDALINRKRARIKLASQGKEATSENIDQFIQIDQQKQAAEGNKCESVSEYLKALEAAGFESVDCIWRDYWLAVFVARKPVGLE